MARGRCSPAYSSLAQLGGDLRGEAAGFNLSSGSPGPGTMHTWGAAPKASSSAGLGWGVRTFNKLLMLLAGRSGAPHRTTGQTAAQHSHDQKSGGVQRAVLWGTWVRPSK